MSLDDYESLQETAYLLRSPRNTRRLLESIQELEAGSQKDSHLFVRVIELSLNHHLLLLPIFMQFSCQKLRSRFLVVFP